MQVRVGIGAGVLEGRCSGLGWHIVWAHVRVGVKVGTCKSECGGAGTGWHLRMWDCGRM